MDKAQGMGTAGKRQGRYSWLYTSRKIQNQYFDHKYSMRSFSKSEIAGQENKHETMFFLTKIPFASPILAFE